eukprot:jgi/Orpsp1_1/1187737/evm.model.d7180000059800.1
MYTVNKLPEREKDQNGCCSSVKIGNKYINPWPSCKSRTKSHFWETFFRVATRKSFKKLPEENFVKVDVDLDAINNYSENEKDIALQLTWLGHSAVLLQVNDFNILFDPLLSFRASPFNFIGHYRYRSKGFKSFNQLPKIDLLVISHNHYDHLDKRAIKKMLKVKKNKNVHVFCPLGLKKWFITRLNLSSSQITECDWWDDYEISKKNENNSSVDPSSVEEEKKENIKSEEKSLKISCVPAQHSSRRSLFDGNKTLWSGWVIKSNDVSFYFAGDTGYRAIPENCSNEERKKYPYCPVFSQIGKIYGPFDFACIPIGPSNDTNSVTPSHVDPVDAINIHKDIKSKHSIPIHWGTVANFCTIDITHDPKLLRQEMKKSGIPLEEFDIVYIGQIVKAFKKDIKNGKEEQQNLIHEE